MFAFVLILGLILQINCADICDSDICLCKRYNSDKEQELEGVQVVCAHKQVNVLQNNYTLPDLAHSLDLSFINISTVHSSPLLTSNVLVELILNDNVITHIDVDSFQLPELKRLDLSNNLLEFIDKDTFKGVKKLEYLNLANNRFTTFTKLMFHRLSNLNEIILDNNNLGPVLRNSNLFDRSGFGLTDKIKSLSISGINLNQVPDNFFVDAYDMRQLIISNNNISQMFEIPMTLEYLDLSDNPITAIFSEDFANLVALKVLKLNNLQIQTVSESTFEYLPALKTLELERNRNLTSFSKLAFGREPLVDADNFALERLSLKGSRVSKLDEDLLTPFGVLTELDLQGNPWNCDCQIAWVKQLQIPEELNDHLRCATPRNLFNARIFDLKPKYFLCNEKHAGLIIGVVSACATLALIALWIFICLPKRQSRCQFIQNMSSSTAAYSVLPLASSYNSHDFNR
ncbi:leucine-rich repeat neuronal protein 3-like [Spodoptera frugiperda]|uniref:Leucine-rich repeat neuronal protein 3-like n=1 Tax=Spodoptera frugiperda TaxID=7108 RepID=A0A9R0DER4_SPOFR|nr:leucine-rich repeat neuronal protein 3-like [Spodoptera frugiperda]